MAALAASVDSFDLVLIGGGLSSALCLLACSAARPEARIAVVEREQSLGGNHTWCFHPRDLPERAQRWVEPLVVRRWPGYTVRFPRRTRRLASAYGYVSSARLHEVVLARSQAQSGVRLYLGRRATALSSHEVKLDDGTTLRGALIVDARGPQPSEACATAGYQKFLGLELEVEPDHALSEPILIDATLPQRDGFRFMYVLPLDERRVLIEETYFSESPALSEAAMVGAIHAYAAGLGLKMRGVLRSERGVLPLPRKPPRLGPLASPLPAGYQGGYFHPVTGYSFPLAVRFADALAHTDPAALERSPLAAFARSHQAQLGFMCFMAHALFAFFEPAQRYSALEHFYRLPEPLVERFYAAELGPLDRVRVLLGRPPHGLSVRRALSFPKGASV